MQISRCINKEAQLLEVSRYFVCFFSDDCVERGNADSPNDTLEESTIIETLYESEVQ